MTRTLSLFILILISLSAVSAQSGYNVLQLADTRGRYKKIAIAPGTRLISADGKLMVGTDDLFISQGWESVGNLTFVYEEVPEPPLTGLVSIKDNTISSAHEQQCTVSRIDGTVVYSGTVGPESPVRLAGAAAGIVIISTGSQTFKAFIRP